MSDSLHTKYRPQNFAEFFGNDAVVSSVEKIIQRKASKAFLITGPSGCGKTTLARIMAVEFGCDPATISHGEINAAIYTGVDDMRAVTANLGYKAFGANPIKVFIIDEAHRLSGNAWDSILKPIEEPPEHVYWFFCTTNPAKVPTTIKTRCTTIQLKGLNEKEMGNLIDGVSQAEKIKLASGVLDLLIREADGSARQALVYLEAVRDCNDRKDAAEVMKTALESDATIGLCRYLLTKGSWPKAMGFIKQLEEKEQDPEGVRIIVVNYMAAVLKGAKTDKEACAVIGILDAFATPYNPAEKSAPLLLSIGRVLFAA